MDRPLFRRRRHIIHPPFQLGAVFSVFASLLFYLLALGVLIFYPLYQEFTAAASLQEQTMLAQVLIELHRRLWPTVGVIVLLVGLQVIFATHRIAGPLYRVQQTLQGLIAGDYQHRIRLRKRDRFKEFEGAINQLAETLEQGREVCSAVHAKLDALEALLEADGHLSGEAGRLIAEMRGGLKRAEGRAPDCAAATQMRTQAEGHRRAIPQGLTLVELLIVLLIIAVIAAIAIPSYLGIIQRAKETAAIAYMHGWVTAQELYKEQDGSYADELEDLVDGGFLSPAPPKWGYEFDIDKEGSEGWSGEGEPNDETWRHFYMDQTGTVRYEVGEEADEDSPPI